MLPGEDAGQADGKVIGLTAAVTEIDSIEVPSQLVAEHLGIDRLHVAEVNLRNVAQGVGLLGDGLDQSRMGVADRNGGNSGDPILVAVALVVEEVLHLAFNHEQGLGVVMEVEFRNIVLPVLDNLLERDTLVGFRLVIEGRHGHREGLRESFADHLIKVYIQI